MYDLLGKEVDMREKRHNVLARQLEITEVEQALRSAIKGVDEEIKVGILEMHVLVDTQVLRTYVVVVDATVIVVMLDTLATVWRIEP